MEIVLTEDDLAAIIAESSRGARAPGPTPSPSDLPWAELPCAGAVGGAASAAGLAHGGDAGGGDAGGAYAPIADAVWRQGVPRPGALDEAIRRILDATTLKPRRPVSEEE